MLFRSVSSQRDIREGAEGSDFLMDPHNALFRRSNSYHNWREQQLYIRGVVQRILDSKNPDAVIKERLVGSGGRTAFSDAEAMAMSNKRDLSEFTPVKLANNGGKTSFFKFHDTNPDNKEYAKSFKDGGQWCGDVYRTIVRLYSVGFEYHTFPDDTAWIS